MDRRPDRRGFAARLIPIAAAVVVIGCARTPVAGTASVESRTIPERPVLQQPFVVQVTVRDDQQQKPMSGATVEIIGQMDHPGMAPVVVNASEAESGIYRGSVTLDMAGRWVLRITAALPDGRRAEQKIDVAIEP